MTSETEIVKKLVEALNFYSNGLHYTEFFEMPDNVKVTIINDRGEVAKEALTEAQAWLERQGKCGEKTGDKPLATAILDKVSAWVRGDMDTGGTIAQIQQLSHEALGEDEQETPPATSQQEARGE